MSNLTLRFDWYLDQNLDPVHDAFFLHLQVSDASSSRYLRYYLNGTATATNSSYNGRYQLHDPPHQWNTFSRNLTADFLAIPAFPKSIDPALQLTTLAFYLWATGSTDHVMRAFMDDVQLEAGTTTVIGGSTRDGDFESHTWNYWSMASNRDASDARQSSTAHSGGWSFNMTAASVGNQSYAYASSGLEPRLTSLNQGQLTFWWRLAYTKATSGSHAYLYLYCLNATDTFWITYWLGYGGTGLVWSNQTNSLYLHADGFNTTGTWMAFHRNVWQDAAAYFHTDEISVSQLYVQVDAYSAGSRVVALFDDTRLVSAALDDTSYEDQGLVGTQVRGWNWMDPSFTVTSMAFGGIKAANLTVAPSSGLTLSQYAPERPLNGTRETYLDVMWQLQTYTPSPGTYAYLGIAFSDGRYLLYYFAISEGMQESNGSSSGSFNVTSVGTTGAWIAIHRDLVHDYQAVFGTFPNTTITSIWLQAGTFDGARLVLLLDDLYLYDDPAPRVTTVQRTPIIPDHGQPAQVTASLVDQDLDKGLLRYRISGGSWQTSTMSYLAGSTYTATIPGQPHDTLVEYYITANDTWGLTSTALSAGAFWSYTVWDQSPPAVTIDAPSNGATVSGTLRINVTASDPASGVAQVQFRIDTGVPVNDSAAPYQYAWDTTVVSNGAHTITVTALDGAGNPASVSVTVTVDNATAPPPIPGFPAAAILLGCGAALGLGFFRRRRLNLR
jgi:hypothetical protein